MAESEYCTAGWCADDDWCAITCGASVLDGKWHPVVVHRLLTDGALGFARLEDRIDGISGTVLSDTLEDLETDGVINREIVSEKPFRVDYSLTERGRDLKPVIAALQEWGERHVEAATC